MSGGSFVGSLVSWAKIKLLVDQATNAEDEPTPIYLLDEVVAAIGSSDTRAGIDAVVARLGARSPVVKQKALKLVTHIGRKGSPELRRLMARQSGAVRELLHFRCSPDPFKGDTVWKRVQEYAQEALNAIHGAQEAAGPVPSSLGGRIQGFGSEVPGGLGGMAKLSSESSSSVGTGSRMVGFGSTDVQSGMQAITSSMRSISGRAGSLLRQDGHSSQLDAGSSAGSGLGSSRAAPTLSQPIMQVGSTALGGSTDPSQQAHAGAEKLLVDRMCAPGGLRAAPSREDLQAFVDGVASLDGPTIARLLEQKLEAGPWQSTLRALCAIEAVAQAGSGAACGHVAAHFQTHPEAVQQATDSPQASVRQRASKLLGLLGVGGGRQPWSGSGSGTGPAQRAPVFSEDLLGPVEPAPAPETAAHLGDLLGGASGAGPGTAHQAATPVPAASPAHLLAELGVAVPTTGPAATPPVNLESDPFGGMLLGGQQFAAATGNAAVPAHSSPIPAAALDPLGGLSALNAMAISPAPAQTLGGVADLLGSLSLGSASTAPGAAAQAAGQAGPALMQQPGAATLAASPHSGLLSMGTPPHIGPQASAPWQHVKVGQQSKPLGMESSSPFSGGTGGGFTLQPPMAKLGNANMQHRQLSANGGSLTMLGSGIIDSPKNPSFSFVDDAMAAARRKK